MNQTTLADGTPVFCMGRNEARFLDAQIAAYLDHGIEIEEGQVVFDVGANIGLFSLRVAQRCNDKTRVYAFEPIPEIYRVAQRNLSSRNHDSVKLLPVGIGKRDETATLTFYPRVPSLSTAYPRLLASDPGKLSRHVLASCRRLPRRLSWFRRMPSFASSLIARYLQSRSRKVTCEMVSISRMIRDHGIPRIDLLKIDNEGAELDALQGIAAADWPKIRQVVAEVHDVGGRLDQMTRLLRTHGLTGITIDQEAGFQGQGLFLLFARRPEA